jgi:hypothetical protein
MEDKTLIAMKYAIQIENLLSELDAEGMGLHDKVTFLKSKTKKNIRFIASIRNQVMHENFVMDQKLLDKFENKSKKVIETLNSKLNKESVSQSKITEDEIIEEVEETCGFVAVPSKLDRVKDVAMGIGKVAFVTGSFLILNEF